MTRRLRRTVLAAVVAGLLALPLAGVTSPAEAKRVEVVPAFRVMTLNIKVTLRPDVWAADARRATTMTDILSLQEASQADDRAALVAMLHGQGWDTWFPATGGTENPVAWNASKFYLVSAESTFVHRGIKGVTPPRFINTVVLADIATGQKVAIVNTHTINRGAVDAGLKPSKVRTPLLKKHLAMLRDKILAAGQLTPNVVATGDLNVNYMRDRNMRLPGLPTDVLGPVVDFVMPVGQTYDYGLTQLDYVMTLKGGGLTGVGGAIVPDFASDHRGVVVGLTYAGQTPPLVAEPLPGSSARFSAGTVTNHPRGKKRGRRAVLREVATVIRNAPTGSAIHLASTGVGDRTIRKVLTKAHNRGVRVQVVVYSKRLNQGEADLRALLGTDARREVGTWFAGCTSTTCRRTADDLPTTLLLVSQAGQTKAVKVLSNQALDTRASHQQARARTSTSLKKYDRGFVKFFRLID